MVLAVGLILTGALVLRGGEAEEALSEYELVHAATVGAVTLEPTDTGEGATATQPSKTQPGLKIKKIKDQEYCPT